MSENQSTDQDYIDDKFEEYMSKSHIGLISDKYVFTAGFEAGIKYVKDLDEEYNQWAASDLYDNYEKYDGLLDD